MLYREIDLYDEYPSLPRDGRTAKLQIYCRSSSSEYDAGSRYPGMIICPGGAYAFTSDREAEPIALGLLARGIQCFVLRYSVAPNRWPAPQLELAAAFDYVRKHSVEFLVRTDAIATLGFSAGGHLIGSYCTHWHDGSFAAALGTDVEQLRPNGMVPCYGVLTTGEFTHDDSIKNLLGAQDSPEMRDFLSTEKHIDEFTPPAFIWHTFADNAVPVQNSLLVALAMANAKVPFEMHVYPRGSHGLALSNWLTSAVSTPDKPPREVSVWLNDCADWLLRLAGIKG